MRLPLLDFEAVSLGLGDPEREGWALQSATLLNQPAASARWGGQLS